MKFLFVFKYILGILIIAIFSTLLPAQSTAPKNQQESLSTIQTQEIISGSIVDDKPDKAPQNSKTTRNTTPNNRPARKGSVLSPAGQKWWQNANLKYGCSGGLSASNSITRIILTPQIGYLIQEKFLCGIGSNLIYTSERSGTAKIAQTIIGINTFFKAYPYSNLVVHIQPEWNRVSYRYEESSTLVDKSSHYVTTLLVGGGWRYDMVQVLLLQNVIQNENNFYGNNPYLSIVIGF